MYIRTLATIADIQPQSLSSDARKAAPHHPSKLGWTKSVTTNALCPIETRNRAIIHKLKRHYPKLTDPHLTWASPFGPVTN